MNIQVRTVVLQDARASNSYAISLHQWEGVKIQLMIRNTSLTKDHHDYIPCEFSLSVNYSPRNATFRGIVSKLNGILHPSQI